MFDIAARELFTADMLKNMPVSIEAARRMHIVIAGFGNMGQAIALQAAKIGHFPNSVNEKSLKTLVTIINTEVAKSFKNFQRFRRRIYRKKLLLL